MYVNEQLTLQPWESAGEKVNKKYMEGLEKRVENGIITYEIKDSTFDNDIEWYPVRLGVDFSKWVKDANHLVIPQSVSRIDCNFWECIELKSFVVHKNNRHFSTDENGALYSFEKDVLYKVPPATKGCFVVPDSVREIRGHAFSSCSKLKEIVIGKRVISIGIHAFYDCHPQNPIIIPENVRDFGGCTPVQVADKAHLSAEFMYKGKMYSYIELNDSFGKKE